jgi:hypothetical protein
MGRFCSFLILTFVITQTSYAESIQTSQEDPLTQVNQKLIQIDTYLKNQKTNVTLAKMEWEQLDRFKSELMFVAAHDPHGPVPKNTPPEMLPSFMTQQLKQKWTDLEVNVISTGKLSSYPEWIAFKDQVEQYIKLREEFLYQSARNSLRSGLMWEMFRQVKISFDKEMEEVSGAKNLSVKVVDPFIEKMTGELSQLHNSVLTLVELRTPKKENPSIFQAKHKTELAVLSIVLFLASVFSTISFLILKKKMTKKVVEKSPPKNAKAFNYYEWLKRLEGSLQTIKSNEENTIEKYLHLKDCAEGLRTARKYLNEADSQQEYYSSLEKLNCAAPKIEDYFDKVNLHKYAEPSRRLINHIVQLCEAIEAKEEMRFDDEKPKLRLMRQEKGNETKAA